VEIKSSVFKKFQNDTLFQILCRDIIDRFEIFFSGFVIALQNLKHAVFGIGELKSIILVLFAEMLTDSVKHAFIAKYNNVEKSVFQDLKFVLCEDVVLNKEEKRSYQKRIGFVPTTYVCFTIIRILFKFLPDYVPLDSFISVLIYLFGFIALLLIKVLLTLSIRGYSSLKLQGQKVRIFELIL
jgi:transmembrane anterior posterior transformation protein 1